MVENSGLKAVIVIVVAVALCGVAEAQSPWTQQDGEGFFQLSYYSIGAYDSLLQDSGPDFRTGREITETTLQAYGEYGLGDRLTLFGSVPFSSPDAGDLVASPTLAPTTIVSGSESTLGNVRFGARYRFDGPRRMVLSGQADLEVPTGSFDAQTGLSTGYEAYTLTPLVCAGRGWNRAYVSGYAGFGLRSDDYSSDWKIGAEGGYSFFDRLWLIGVIDVRQSFSDGDVALNPTQLQTGLYVNDQEFVAIGGKALLDLTRRFGLQLTVQGAAQGNNVPSSALVGFGMYYRLR